MKPSNSFTGKLTKIFQRTPLPKTGLYHYRREGDDEKTRIHLRIDPDGRGLLIVNANRVVHLNPS
ncbi:MAG: hypothetical protein H0S82_03665, partial [Anaerolineaceae bacterium]|nr:hypothetical protein [Anaerolineaceae bacterium]